MTRRYYRLEDEAFGSAPTSGRWFLGGLSDRRGSEFDPRVFRRGGRFSPGSPLALELWNSPRVVEVAPPMRVSVRREGMPMDFTYADGELPVVKKWVAALLEEACGTDVQRFPVVVEGAADDYEIVNVVPLLACIDKARSDIESWWTEDDNRPDKLGHPRSVRKLVVDTDQVGGHHIFRIEGWPLWPVASDVLKGALECGGVTGIRFRSVSA